MSDLDTAIKPEPVPGLLLSPVRNSTVSLMTMMHAGMHRLKKKDGTNVSMPEEIDVLLALMPTLQEFVPEGYRVITRRPKFRKFIDDHEIKLEKGGTPDIGDPPQGMSGIEAVMWREIGPMACKACCWLYIWLDTGSYKKAKAYTGLEQAGINMLIKSSSVFKHLYTLVKESVNHNYMEDNAEEIHRRGHDGVVEDVYGTVMDPDGNKVTGVVGQKRVYDNKLLVRDQESLSSDFRRTGDSGSSGVVVNIQVNGMTQCKPEDVITASVEDIKDVEEVEEED